MKNYIIIILLLYSGWAFNLQSVDTVLFSSSSGFFSESFQLSLSNTQGNDIRYSLDGSYPKTSYSGPITISQSTTIRVRNSKSTKGFTRNFIFHPRKVSLPIICITIDPSDLYDSVKGMYVKGPGADSKSPYKGANFHKNIEKLAYIELIDTNNNIEFNQRIGLKIFGQYSAMLPQKSFSVHAKKKYGDKRIRASIFPDRKFKKYKSIVIRNSGSDFCNTHFRDIMMTSLVKDLNIETQAYRSCIVYLNGKYWGIYHLREKINEFYIKQHFKIDKDSVAIVRHKGGVQHYGRLNYNNMLKFLKTNDFKESSMVDSLSKLMDIDNYLDYNISQVYFNNIDAGGNIRYWRSIANGSKWRWILFDTDFGFGLRPGNDVEENSLKNFTTYSSEAWPHPSWSTLIIRKLLENDSIKVLYIKKMTWLLNTTFSSENVLNHIDKIETSLNQEMESHFKKWKRSYNIWSTQKDKIKDFAQRRPSFIFLQMKDKFNLSPYYSLSVDLSGNNKIVIDGVQIESGKKYTLPSNIKMHINAIPQFGYQFDGWEKDTIYKNELTITKDTELSPIFSKKELSEANGVLLLNEISWKDSISSDYIEIFNSGNSTIDISEWVLIRDGLKKFIFPKKTIIEPNSYLTVTKNLEKDNKIIKGLFSIKESSLIELFTNEEKLVDGLQLNETENNFNIKERVNSIIESGWFNSDTSTINSENKNQELSKQKTLYILFGFLLLFCSLFATLVIFSIRNKKRLHSSTE